MIPGVFPAARRPFERFLAAAAVLSSALLWTPAAQAQWKWRDADGSIQLSDRPPPLSVPERNILQRPGPPKTVSGMASTQAKPASTTPPSAASAASGGITAPREKTSLEREVEQRRKAEEQERLARRKADESRQTEQRRDNCQRAQQAVATMDSGQRIARLNAQGEREVLSDEQRASERRRAQAVVDSDCR